MKVGLKVAPYLLPLPIETYLRVHFTKVGDQTLFFLKSWQTSAEVSGVSSAELGSWLPLWKRSAREPSFSLICALSA